jgi:hypothetical protein
MRTSRSSARSRSAAIGRPTTAARRVRGRSIGWDYVHVAVDDYTRY